MWLECIGVVIIIMTFPYSTCISSFFDSSIPISSFIFKMFFRSCYVIFVKYIANVAQRTFEIVQKSRSVNNSIIKNVERIQVFKYYYVALFGMIVHTIHSIIESVDSKSKDERGFPLTQYITNGRISRDGYTFTHFKHHHRVLRLISYSMSI